MPPDLYAIHLIQPPFLVFRDLAARQDSVITPRIKVYCMVLTMVNCEERKQYLREKQQGTGSKHTREMNYKLFC